MGKILTLGGQKGGSGKSTASFHISVELMSRGYTVATLDLDTKMNTYYLYQRRHELRHWLDNGHLPENSEFLQDIHLEIIPKAVMDGIKRNGLPMPDYQNASGSIGSIDAVIERLRDNSDVLIIDTGGGDANINRRAILFADLFVVPILPSTLDTDSLPETVEVIDMIKHSKYGMKVRSLINQRPTHANDFRAKQLSLILDMYPELQESFKTKLDFLFSYRDSLTYGLGVAEWNNSKAKGQVSYLVKEIIEELEND